MDVRTAAPAMVMVHGGSSLSMFMGGLSGNVLWAGSLQVTCFDGAAWYRQG